MSRQFVGNPYDIAITLVGICVSTTARFFHDDGSQVLRPEEDERRQKIEEREKRENAVKFAASERAEKEAALAEVERLRKLLESQ